MRLPLFELSSAKKLHVSLLSISHWPELSHMVTSSSKEGSKKVFILGNFVPSKGSARGEPFLQELRSSKTSQRVARGGL